MSTEQMELALFEHILRELKSEFVTAAQVHRALGWSLRTIYDMVDADELDAHDLPKRGKRAPKRTGAKRIRRDVRIRRASVIVFAVRTARYSAAEFPKIINLLWRGLTREQLLEVRKSLDAEITTRPL